MDITDIKNKIITYKNYGNLNKSLVSEIQDVLLSKSKETDFETLLKKIESEIKK